MRFPRASAVEIGQLMAMVQPDEPEPEEGSQSFSRLMEV